MITLSNEIHSLPDSAPVIWRTPKYTGPERRKMKRRRPRPVLVLLALLPILWIGYTVAVLSLMGDESSLVLDAGRTLGPDRPRFRYEQIDIPREDGRRQFAWGMPRGGSDAGPWALFLHGNASTIASSVNLAHYRVLRTTGLNVFAPEYRGFGGLDGIPTEAALRADARAAYDYLRGVRKVDPRRIVIYGWSLGSAVAIDLAPTVDHAALVLEAAPASQVAISRSRYPFFPIRLLMRNPFDSIDKIDHIRSPILFLHSPEDAIVPIAEGRRLFDAARTEKTFVEIPGGHVNAADVDPAGLSDAIGSFLKQHGLLTPTFSP
jgi:fermentation-respiration switch protein FrsA (DUF1100 family)